MGYSHRFWCVCVRCAVVNCSNKTYLLLEFSLDRFEILVKCSIWLCHYGVCFFKRFVNFWIFWRIFENFEIGTYICYTLHYTFERTVRHSVFVAQRLAHRTGVREVPSSIPLYVTYILSSFYFFMVCRFNYINVLHLNMILFYYLNINHEWMVNIWRFSARDLCICSTLHCAFECTSRHSVSVAQWLTQWTYMREVPGSIPIDVTCLFHHFIFLMAKSLNLVSNNLT